MAPLFVPRRSARAVAVAGPPHSQRAEQARSERVREHLHGVGVEVEGDVVDSVVIVGTR